VHAGISQFSQTKVLPVGAGEFSGVVVERVAAALIHFCVIAVAAETWLDPLVLAEAEAELVPAADDPLPELEQPASARAPLRTGIRNIISPAGPVIRDFLSTCAPGLDENLMLSVYRIRSTAVKERDET
jgi:hypothetical protein